jgi:hypothetical protein
MSTQQISQIIVDLQDMEQLLKRARSECEKVLNLLNIQRIVKKKEEKRSESETQFLNTQQRVDSYFKTQEEYDKCLFETHQQFEGMKLTASSPNASSEDVKQAIYKNDGKVRTLTNVHIEGQYTMALEVESNKTKRFFTNMLVYV